MFNKQERRKSKYKYGGTKVCKAEEVKKYFVNPKVFGLRVINLFVVWISVIQKQPFADVLWNRCS